MTHTEQPKKRTNSCPFVIGELEVADFVALHLVLFLPVQFVDKVINALQYVISECGDYGLYSMADTCTYILCSFCPIQHQVC